MEIVSDGRHRDERRSPRSVRALVVGIVMSTVAIACRPDDPASVDGADETVPDSAVVAECPSPADAEGGRDGSQPDGAEDLFGPLGPLSPLNDIAFTELSTEIVEAPLAVSPDLAAALRARIDEAEGDVRILAFSRPGDALGVDSDLVLALAVLAPSTFSIFDEHCTDLETPFEAIVADYNQVTGGTASTLRDFLTALGQDPEGAEAAYLRGYDNADAVVRRSWDRTPEEDRVLQPSDGSTPAEVLGRYEFVNLAVATPVEWRDYAGMDDTIICVRTDGAWGPECVDVAAVLAIGDEEPVPQPATRLTVPLREGGTLEIHLSRERPGAVQESLALLGRIDSTEALTAPESFVIDISNELVLERSLDGIQQAARLAALATSGEPSAS